MSDLRSIVDRELERVELRPFTLDAFHRRRERKRRNERIVAGLVGIAIALIAVLIGTSIIRSSPVPANPHPGPPSSRGVELTYSTDAGIVAVDIGTGQLRTIVPGLQASGFAWSPDGSELVYETKTEQCRVVVRTIETGKERVLAGCGLPGTYGTTLDWSADGNWIAFGTQGGAPGHRFVRSVTLIHPDGTGKRALPDATISFSPDGSRIAFGSFGKIYTMNVDGSGRRFLAKGSAPDWSPDGARIAFVRDSYPIDVWQIWSIHPNGSGLTRLSVGRAAASDCGARDPSGRRTLRTSHSSRGVASG